MTYTAGARRQRLTLQVRKKAMEWGQQVLIWEDVTEVYANIANETGIAAAKTNVLSGVPTSSTRYSLSVDGRLLSKYSIGTDHRLIHKVTGQVLSVVGTILDYNSGGRQAYIMAVSGLSND